MKAVYGKVKRYCKFTEVSGMLGANVCQDGMALKIPLNRKTNIRNIALLEASPCLLKRAVKTRSCETEFTPQAKRVIYIDDLLEY